MPLPNRTFGIEIEATRLQYSQAVDAIEDAGYDARSEGYHHDVTPYWKVVEDGSIDGRSPFEAVSPVLRGEDGILEARTVARALNRAGAQVNRSCGLHVHVDVSDFTPTELATIVLRYSRFLNDIDTWMPRSRRNGNNEWCRSISEWANILDERNRLDDYDIHLQDLTHNQPGRYSLLNLMPLSRQGTIEFRQHGGTLNPSKIENWVRFLLYFVETCRTPIHADATTTVESPNGDQFTRRAARGVVIPVDDTVFRNIPNSVRTFFTERAEELQAAEAERQANR